MTLVVLALVVIWIFPTPIGEEPFEPQDSAVAIENPRAEAQPGTPADPLTPSDRPAPAPGSGVVPTVASAVYTVEAALYRLGKSGTRERLESGSRLALEDKLILTIEASRELYVYVINEDAQGRASALFPMHGFELQNPLPAHQRHTLPGSRDGEEKSWEVNSRGGREHLLLVGSPVRLIEFEAEMDKLPRPREGQMAMPIPESARVHLRGIGGLADAPQRVPGATAGRLFEMAEQLEGRPERVEGAWVRRFELENPVE